MSLDITLWSRDGGDIVPESVTFEVNGHIIKGYRNIKEKRFYISALDLSEMLGYSSEEHCLPIVPLKQRKRFSDLILDDVEFWITNSPNFENIEDRCVDRFRKEGNPVIKRAELGGYKKRDGSRKTNVEVKKTKSANFLKEFGVNGKTMFISESALHKVIMRATKSDDEMKDRLSAKFEQLSREEYLLTLPDNRDTKRMREIAPKVNKFLKYGMDNIEKTEEVISLTEEYIDLSRKINNLSLAEVLLGQPKLSNLIQTTEEP